MTKPKAEKHETAPKKPEAAPAIAAPLTYEEELQALGSEGEQLDSELEHFDPTIFDNDPDMLLNAATSMRESAIHYATSGAPLVGNRLEAMATQLDTIRELLIVHPTVSPAVADSLPMPPSALVRPVGPIRQPAVAPAKRPNLGAPEEISQGPNRPAKRPNLEAALRPKQATPDLQAETARMLGLHPAKRPTLGAPPDPRRYGTRVARPANVVVPGSVEHRRVMKAARIHTREGTFELAEGSVVSSQTHDLALLDAQGVETTVAADPVKAPTLEMLERDPHTVSAGFEMVVDELPAVLDPEGVR